MTYKNLDTEIKRLVDNGIFSHEEIAKGLKLSQDMFKELLTEELKLLIDFWIVQNKASLASKVFYLAERGEKYDEVKLAATKYLLAALHGLNDKTSIEQASLALRRQSLKFNQTLKAASMSTQWDADMTEKFIENVKKVEKVL
jgi:hypothetical protein